MSDADTSLIRPQPPDAGATSAKRLTVDGWTDDETIPCAGRMLGLGRTATYAALQSGQIPSIRVGRRYLVPIAALHRMLGMGDAA